MSKFCSRRGPARISTVSALCALQPNERLISLIATFFPACVSSSRRQCLLFLVGGRREASQAFAELLNDLEFDEHRPGLGADDLFWATSPGHILRCLSFVLFFWPSPFLSPSFDGCLASVFIQRHTHSQCEVWESSPDHPIVRHNDT